MRNLELDGLRGVAALGVVIFHAHYGELFEWMWTFVDLFFVLSGFLIARIVLRSLQDNAFSLKNFMIRRIIRIWPIYYLTLIACSLVILVNYLLVGSWEHTSGIFSAPFFLQYTHHYLQPSFNGGGEDFIFWFHHSWSIAVEEQFYLLMPLLMIFLKQRLNIFLAIIVCLIPIAVYFRLNGAFQWLLVARMDALCIGIILAFYWVAKEDGYRFDKWIGRPLAASLFLVALFLIVLPQYMNASFEVASAFSLFGFNLVFGVIVLTLLEGWSNPLGSLLSSRVMVFFGAISYALYLFHVPVRGAILYVLDQESIAACPVWVQAFYFGVSILAAYLSKILIEDRVNRLKHRFPVSVPSTSQVAIDRA